MFALVSETGRGAKPPMQTIEDWLSQLGLGKYVEAFVQNDVDLRALPHVTEADLQELGVSLGHRKIILAAINGLAQSGLDGVSHLLHLPLKEPERSDHSKSRRNRLPTDGFSVCSSVTWSARPRYRRNSTRKTCTS